MVTYSDLIRSPEVAAARPILAEVAATIADRQVQNRGTVGGNVCVNDPTNHLPPLLSALDASFTILGADGERTVIADEFFVGVYMTAAGEGELLTRISVPVAAPGHGRRDGGRDARGCTGRTSSAPPRPSGPTACAWPSAASRACPSAPLCSRSACSGAELSAEAVHAAVAGIGDALDPPADVHAPADYRRRLAEVCCERAVLSAAKRARG